MNGCIGDDLENLYCPRFRGLFEFCRGANLPSSLERNLWPLNFDRGRGPSPSILNFPEEKEANTEQRLTFIGFYKAKPGATNPDRVTGLLRGDFSGKQIAFAVICFQHHYGLR